MKKLVLALAAGGASILLFAGSASAATIYYVDPTGNDGNACTASGSSACLTVQGAVNKASAGDTIDVAAGTYSGNIIIPNGDNNLTIQSTGAVTFNLGSGYGVNLDNGYAVTGFTLSGFTFNSTSGTTYAFKAYKADHLDLTNDTFNGNTYGGGVDINTTSHVMLDNVSASGFHKNGFAVTAAYTVGDEATPSSDITFNNITSSNNGWTGLSFYTIGNDHSPSSIGGSASITGVQFTGTDTISGDTSAGIFVEGDSDANFGALANPANTVTTDGTTLDLSHVAFTSDPTYDIVNYQSAPVNAIGATFGGLTGDQMTNGQRSTEDGHIFDQLDHSNLGLVTYYHPNVTVTIDKYLDGSMATAVSANNSAFPMASTWVTTNFPSGSGTYTLSPVGFNSPNPYEAVTSEQNYGSSYTTNEDTTTSLVGASCADGKPYALVGYSVGDSQADAAAATVSATAPSFSDLQQNEYVIVWNVSCGSLMVTKRVTNDQTPTTFTFTGTGDLGTFTLTASKGHDGSEIFLLPAGTYSVTETVPNGWVQNTNSCINVVVSAGGSATCTIKNTQTQSVHVHNTNNAVVINNTSAGSNTGDNGGGLSTGGLGGTGGSASNGGGGGNHATGGAGGNGGTGSTAGGVVTGSSNSSANTTNLVNFNFTRVH